MTVPASAQRSTEHPSWCFVLACNFDEPGGEHASKGRLIPTDTPAPLLIDLVQRPDQPTKVRLTCGEAEVLMPLRSARNLAAVVDVLAKTGRRAEPR